MVVTERPTARMPRHQGEKQMGGGGGYKRIQQRSNRKRFLALLQKMLDRYGPLLIPPRAIFTKVPLQPADRQAGSQARIPQGT